MAANKAVWGIDLGQSALKALCLRASEDKVEAVNHFYFEHPRILSHPEADRPALIAKAMKEFTSKHDLSDARLVVAVPGQHTLARFSKLPPVQKKKIVEIVRYEAQQQIPFDLDEVIWDYQVFEGGDSAEAEVGIFAMRRDLLRDHLRYLADLNLEPAAVQATPLAMYNAIRHEGICGDQPTCILDIGTQNTDLVVVEGDSLWTRNIPIGGNNFTETLLTTFKLSFSKAERLKRDAQKHKYARQIFQAMRPAFADLVAEVQRSIGFFSSSRRGVKLSKIIGMGNAFKLPGMVKFIQQNLGMEVVRPSSFSKLSVTADPNAAELTDHILSFGVAYGLALQGLDRAQITSSLLPPEIRKQVIWRKKTPWFYGAAACLCLSAGVVWGRNFMDSGTVAGAQPERSVPSFSVQGTGIGAEPDPKALQVLDSGPSATTAVGKAKWVLSVNKHLSEVYSQIQSSNDERIAAVKEIEALQGEKAVWPRILKMIHDALPAPDKDLAEALVKGPEAYRALIEARPDDYNRANRKEVFIEEFRAAYSEDILTKFKERESGGQAQPEPVTGRRGSRSGRGSVEMLKQLPGFLIEMQVRTPNQGGFSFLNQTFLKNLNGAEAPGIYVAKVSTPYVAPVKGAQGAGAGVRGPNIADAEGETLRSVESTEKDPVTDEWVFNDWKFEVIVAVVLGDKSESASMSDRGVEDDDFDE